MFNNKNKKCNFRGIKKFLFSGPKVQHVSTLPLGRLRALEVNEGGFEDAVLAGDFERYFSGESDKEATDESDGESDSSELGNPEKKEVIMDQLAPEFDISSLTKEVEAMEMENAQAAAADPVKKKVKIVFPKARIWVSL